MPHVCKERAQKNVKYLPDSQGKADLHVRRCLFGKIVGVDVNVRLRRRAQSSRRIKQRRDIRNRLRDRAVENCGARRISRRNVNVKPRNAQKRLTAVLTMSFIRDIVSPSGRFVVCPLARASFSAAFAASFLRFFSAALASALALSRFLFSSILARFFGE